MAGRIIAKNKKRYTQIQPSGGQSKQKQVNAHKQDQLLKLYSIDSYRSAIITAATIVLSRSIYISNSGTTDKEGICLFLVVRVNADVPNSCGKLVWIPSSSRDQQHSETDKSPLYRNSPLRHLHLQSTKMNIYRLTKN